MCREQQNSTERIRLVALDSANAGVTGATVLLSIRRDADGFYWTGAAFGAGFNTVAMTETDATNRAGEYHYDFNTSGLADAVYSFRATSATAAIINDPWEGEIKIGGFVDFIDIEISSRLATSGYTTPPTVGAISTDVWGAASRTLTASLDPTAATIADAICDEIVSGHLTAGSVGDYLNRIKKVVFNRLVVATGTYTVYEDNGSSTFSTGATSADDGNRTPT